LSGTVQADDVRAVLDGRTPDTGRSVLWVRRLDRLPGFDLTFSAPKGVSLLFALADPRTSRLVREAHDRAVAAALGYLEREAGEVRRGRDGVDRLPGGGFVAAAFRHRTSRAGDPQLHTHVQVANMTRGCDGRWSALDGRQLYWQAKTAGTLYQAALRHELRALGLRFVMRENGLFELADVPRPVLRAFSRRRVEIEAELARRGSHPQLIRDHASRSGAHRRKIQDRRGFTTAEPNREITTTQHLPRATRLLRHQQRQLISPRSLTIPFPSTPSTYAPGSGSTGWPSRTQYSKPPSISLTGLANSQSSRQAF
jgi:conjugative relaxase-like TrwC/TraI family protein